MSLIERLTNRIVILAVYAVAFVRSVRRGDPAPIVVRSDEWHGPRLMVGGYTRRSRN